MNPKVFICYAREDAGVAKKLSASLAQANVDPWLDTECLLGGDPYEVVIRKAIRESSCMIAILSSKSLEKRGFVQKELRMALSQLDEMPEGQIYLIPARVDECEPTHERLRALHWVDLFPSYDEGVRKLIQSIRRQYPVAPKQPHEEEGSNDPSAYRSFEDWVYKRKKGK